MVRILAAATLGTFLAASGAATARVSPDSGVRTIATIPNRVSWFEQNERYRAWLTAPYGQTTVILDRRTGRATPVKCGAAQVCDMGTGSDLALVGDRAYWVSNWGSLSHDYLTLYTARAGERRAREIAFQSFYKFLGGALDPLVPPESDGRNVYFWSTVDDLAP